MSADREDDELIEFRAVIDVRLDAYDIDDALHRLTLHFLASSVLDIDAPSLIHAPSDVTIGRVDDPQFAEDPVAARLRKMIADHEGAGDPVPYCAAHSEGQRCCIDKLQVAPEQWS